MGVGFGIDLDRQFTEMSERPIAKRRIDALSADGHSKSVGDFEPPQGGRQAALVRHPVEYCVDRRRSLVLEIP